MVENGTIADLVPAHAGGVDLSLVCHTKKRIAKVPAHAGGVDLSSFSIDMP